MSNILHDKVCICGHAREAHGGAGCMECRCAKIRHRPVAAGDTTSVLRRNAMAIMRECVRTFPHDAVNIVREEVIMLKVVK